MYCAPLCLSYHLLYQINCAGCNNRSPDWRLFKVLTTLLGLKPSQQHPERKGLFSCCRSGYKRSRTPTWPSCLDLMLWNSSAPKEWGRLASFNLPLKGELIPNPTCSASLMGVRRWFEFRNLLAVLAKGFKSAADSLLMIQRKFRKDGTHTYLMYSSKIII